MLSRLQKTSDAHSLFVPRFDVFHIYDARCDILFRIKIWTLDNDGQWTLEDDWKVSIPETASYLIPC